LRAGTLHNQSQNIPLTIACGLLLLSAHCCWIWVSGNGRVGLH